MDEMRQLAAELKTMTDFPPSPSRRKRYPGPPGDELEQPNVFARWRLARLVFVVAAVLGVALYLTVDPARPAPDYRHGAKHQEGTPTEVLPAPGSVSSRLWVAARGGGVGSFHPDRLLWGAAVNRKSTRGGLLSDCVTGVDVAGDRALFVCEEDSRRGLAFSKADPDPQRDMFWDRPFLDLTHLGQSTGDTLTCAASGADANELFLGSDGDGIGRYDRATRSWRENLNRLGGTLSDDHVHDLLRVGDGFLVANDHGIDLCRQGRDLWELRATVSGMTSKGVRRLYSAGGSASDSDVWFVTAGRGVGAVTIRPDASVANQACLISERSVPGLTLEACRTATCDPATGNLWVAFGQGGGVGVARYRFGDHDWAGTPEALPAKEICCLSAEERGSGLVGTENGVLQAWDAQGEGLLSAWRGPQNERIAEIVSSRTLTWAHSEGKAAEGDSPTRVRLLALGSMVGSAPWPWQDFIGPRRFPTLRQEDLLSAARCGTSATYYFGTRGKGIGAFQADSREVFQVFHSKHSDAARRLPDDDVLDLTCPDLKQIAAVTGKNGLMLYDGARWKMWIEPSGLPGKEGDVRSVACDASRVAVACDPSVGVYDSRAHLWKSMPDLPDVQRLHYAGQYLWGLTSSGALLGLSRQEALAGKWEPAAEDVVTFAGGASFVAALAGKSPQPRRLLISEGVMAKLGPMAAPVPLPRRVEEWDTACSDNGSLYLASVPSREVARYDLSSHEWESFRWPAEAGASARLEATAAGLWLLTGEGELYLWKAQDRKWTPKPVLAGVRTFATDGNDLLAIVAGAGDDAAGSNGMLRLTDDQRTSVLIGRPLAGDPSATKAAADFAGRLFLSSSKSLARYDKGEHDWKDLPLPGGERLKAFAPTTDSLYALLEGPGGEFGKVARYTSRDDQFASVKDPADPNEELLARRIASEDKGVAIQSAAGDVLFARDGDVGRAEAAYSSSGLSAEGRTVLCAAECGAELYLGMDDGRVWAYQSGADGLPRWTTSPGVAVGDPATAPAGEAPGVRRVLLLDGGKTQVVVRDSGISMETRTAVGQPWRSLDAILSGARGCDAWDAGESRLLYSAVKDEACRKAGCYSQVGLRPLGGRSDGIELVGDGLAPAASPGQTISVAEWTDANGNGFVFRADSSGALGRYSLRQHRWQYEGLAGVQDVFSSLGGAWAYSPKAKALFALGPPGDASAWAAHGKAPIADAVGDRAGLLLRQVSGAVELLQRDGSGGLTSRFLASSGLPAGVGEPGELRACAETDGGLLCGFAAVTLNYDLSSHAWSKALDRGVEQFLRTSGAEGRLLAVLSDGKVARWTAEARFEILPTPGTAARLVAAGSDLCLYTKEGGLCLLSPDGRATILLDPAQRMVAADWPAVTAAAEWKGELLLGLRGAGKGAIAAYDPAAMKWTSCDLNDVAPDRFLPVGEKLLVLCAGSTGARSLWLFDLAASRAQPLAVDIRNACADGKNAWWVSEDGSLYCMDLSAMKVTLVAKGSLPVSARLALVDVKASGGELLAVLGDGSIWHHGASALGWRQVLAPAVQAPAGFQRQVIEVNGRILTSSASGEILMYDASQGKYLRSDGKISLPAQPDSPMWEVRKAEKGIQVKSRPSTEWMSLTGGLLPSDDVRELAADSGYLYCRTAAGGFRAIDCKTLSDVDGNVSAALVEQKLRRPSPLAFDEKAFACAPGKGAWKTPDAKVNCEIVQKRGGKSLPVLPCASQGRIGFAHQWATGLAFQNGTIFIAIPGGVMTAAVSQRQLGISRIDYPGGAIPCRLFTAGADVYLQTDKDRCLRWNASGSVWADVEAGAGAAAQAASAAAEFADRSALGPTWAWEGASGAGSLTLAMRDGKRMPVALSKEGFSFDRVAGMSLGKDSVQLLTAAGMVNYRRQPPAGAADSIDPRPAADAQMLQVSSRIVVLPGFDPILYARDKTRAWGFRDGKWLGLQAGSVEKALGQAVPLLLDGQACKWSRADQVRLAYPGREKDWLATSFDAAIGRLGIDQAVSIGAFEGSLWAVTRSGICRLDPKGAVTVFLNEDAAYDWSKTGRLLVARMNGKDGLYATLTARANGEMAWLQFDGAKWNRLSAGAQTQPLVEAERWLLQGEQWRVHREEVNAPGPGGRALHRHWPWQGGGEFARTSLGSIHKEYSGTFDFERINDILLTGGKLLLATDAGVVHVDPAARSVVSITAPAGKAQSVGRLMQKAGRAYAQAGGLAYAWDDAGRQWTPARAENPFDEPPVLVDSKDWSLLRTNGRLTVRHRLARRDKDLTGVALEDVGNGKYRFSFDVATGVAATPRGMAILTPMGLIQRPGDAPQDIKRADLPAGSRGGGGDLFCYGQKEDPRIVYRRTGEMLEYDGASDTWKLVAPDRRAAIESARESILTWNKVWRVEKDKDKARFSVRFPQDPTYKPVAYVPSSGLFAFDLFNDVAVCSSGGGKEDAVLVATQGGVVRVTRDKKWQRLYCDTEADGLPAQSVEGLAGQSLDRVMARTGGARTGAATFAFLPEKDRWQEQQDPESGTRFAALRATCWEDPNGWRVLDLRQYRAAIGAAPAPAACPVAISWKGQPVWLRQQAGRIRFGHDIIYSVTASDDSVWLGTAGGCVRYPMASAAAGLGTMDLAAPEIHSKDFLGRFDPWSPPSGPRVGLLKKRTRGEALACFLLPENPTGPDADEAVQPKACYLLAEGGAFVAAASAEAQASALASQVVAEDGLFRWVKTGPTRLALGFLDGKADVPTDYPLLGDGTFRFYDASYLKDRRPREQTMVRCFAKVFFATPGGIMSYDEETGTPLKLYAEARGLGRGASESAVPLSRVRRLYYDPGQQALYASDSVGARFAYRGSGSPGGDHWYAQTNGPDPFANADVVVANDLLVWRQLDAGPSVSLTHTDLWPGAPYELFSGGKFSFDYVHALAFQGSKVWLATAGGAVCVDRMTRRIEKVYAQDFPFQPGRRLPDIREVIYDPQDGGGLCARAGENPRNRTCLKLTGDRWKVVPAAEVEPAFRRQYVRHADGFWTWVQPPQGLYVQLHNTTPPDLSFGNAVPDAHASLMSRGRLAWDDLREAVMVEDELLAATPAGVCCYAVDFDRQTATLRNLCGRAAGEGLAQAPMLGLDRLVKAERGELLAWNSQGEQVFRGRRSEGRWQWTVDREITPLLMVSQKKLADADGTWTLRRASESEIEVTYCSAGGTAIRRSVRTADRVPDLSRAAITDKGIWFPTERDVIWVDTSLFRGQSRLLPWTWFAGSGMDSVHRTVGSVVGSAGAALVVLALALGAVTEVRRMRRAAREAGAQAREG